MKLSSNKNIILKKTGYIYYGNNMKIKAFLHLPGFNYKVSQLSFMTQPS